MTSPVATAPSCDVAVIGGGIGGLTAGALLARAGARVIICEQHSRPGGYCHSWSRVWRRGSERLRFSFDAAVHDVSGAYPDGPVRRILGWLGADERLEWCRGTHEYCVGSTSVRVAGDADCYVTELIHRFPSEAHGIRQFFRLFRTSYDELFAHAALTSGLPRAPLTAAEMRSFQRLCPTLSSLAARPFKDVRDPLVHDHVLRTLLSVLSFYVTDDPNRLTFAQMLPLFGYYFRGGYYPRGGSQALADVLAGAVRGAGGEVRIRAPVARIHARGGRVTGLALVDRTFIRADVVISNADPQQTLGALLEQGPTADPPRACQGTFRPSNSAFMVFLGLKTDLPLASATVVLRDGNGVIISCPPCGEHRAPPGFSTVTLTGLVSAQEAQQWDRRSAAYRRMKQEAGDRLIALASSRVPDLLEHVVYREDATPATLHRYVRATGGAAYGATPDTRWKRYETPVSGLYLVGASVGLGPGIEAVMVSGAALAERLLGGSALALSSARSFGG